MSMSFCKWVCTPDFALPLIVEIFSDRRNLKKPDLMKFFVRYFSHKYFFLTLDKFFYQIYTCYGYVFTTRYIATLGFLPAYFRVLFATRNLDKFSFLIQVILAMGMLLLPAI